jgi:16S rRNA (cytosine1402-N4)-methyltransferase
MDARPVHIPVLVSEVLDGLDVRPGGKYIDCTLGTGGHARRILEKSTPDGRLLGIDVDASAIEVAKDRLAQFAGRSQLVRDNFRQLDKTASEHSFLAADGVLFDLGVSWPQLQEGHRGFSFQQDGPLDMRMDLDGEVKASHLVNQLGEAELARILAEYGEEPKSRAIARAIVRNRSFRTTLELADVVARVVGPRRRRHPATKTFQALRIAVNEELSALSEALPQALAVLASGGRLAVITFHSLEDRVVKTFMARESRDCVCPPEIPVCMCHHRRTLRILTKKPIRPSIEEIKENPRCRSAKLRVATRL